MIPGQVEDVQSNHAIEIAHLEMFQSVSSQIEYPKIAQASQSSIQRVDSIVIQIQIDKHQLLHSPGIGQQSLDAITGQLECLQRSQSVQFRHGELFDVVEREVGILQLQDGQ